MSADSASARDQEVEDAQTVGVAIDAAVRVELTETARRTGLPICVICERALRAYLPTLGAEMEGR